MSIKTLKQQLSKYGISPGKTLIIMCPEFKSHSAIKIIDVDLRHKTIISERVPVPERPGSKAYSAFSEDKFSAETFLSQLETKLYQVKTV